MDIRQIRENFGRVKAYYLKNDTLRAMGVLIVGLKEAIKLSGGLPTDVRSQLREAVQFINRDEMVKKFSPNGVSYQPSQERQLLISLVDIYKKIQEDNEKEDYEVAKERKQCLDQALNLGLKNLEAGKISEADQCFQEAISFYKNEHRIFFYIAKSLIDAGQVKRAGVYIKKGLELVPTDKEMANLQDKAMRVQAEGAE